jgi:hypothetical protein
MENTVSKVGSGIIDLLRFSFKEDGEFPEPVYTMPEVDDDE